MGRGMYLFWPWSKPRPPWRTTPCLLKPRHGSAAKAMGAALGIEGECQSISNPQTVGMNRNLKKGTSKPEGWDVPSSAYVHAFFGASLTMDICKHARKSRAVVVA